MIKKPKKKTRGQLVKILDSRFSKYIRLLYSDKNGKCKCVTCGAVAIYKNHQCGHFITRANYKYRRDEKNCYVQCVKCNIFLSGNYKAYTLFMIEKLGIGYVKKITSEVNKPFIIKSYEIEEKIEFYKDKVEKMLTKQASK